MSIPFVRGTLPFMATPLAADGRARMIRPSRGGKRAAYCASRFATLLSPSGFKQPMPRTRGRDKALEARAAGIAQARQSHFDPGFDADSRPTAGAVGRDAARKAAETAKPRPRAFPTPASLAATLALAFTLPALGAPSDTAERAIKLDQTVQALKDEVLQFNSEATGAEVDAVLPDYRRLNVYLSVKAGGLLLKEVSVSIDDRKPEIYHYDDFDSRAILAKDALQRLLRVAADPGPHRVHVAFVGQFADAKPDAAALHDEYSVTIDKPPQATDLEFVIARESRFGGKPKLTMKQWRPAQ